MKKNLFTFLGLVIVINLLSFALTPTVVAEDVGSLINQQLEPVQDVYGNSDVDDTTFATAIAEIIRIVLGFLGVIFIVLIIYAGFLWMTSAGSEEKVKKAKDIMVAATIGVAIVLLAYAITYFVINMLLEATMDGSGLG